MKKTCRYCGKEFIAEASSQNHCSLDCRFWSKVMAEEIGKCWIWSRSKIGKGYGQFRIKGKETATASRVIWEHLFGPLPEGMWVLHKCDNPSCVNPFHLYAGTPSRNNQDSIDRGRRHPPKGEGHSRSIVSEPIVLEIRRLREEGMILKEIGKRFGLSKRHVGKICSRDLWDHVKAG